MTEASANVPFKLDLLCYPYYPSKETGRGHDRYAFELQHNLLAIYPEITLRTAHQGFLNGVFSAAAKQFNLIFDLLSSKAGIYHAISPIGGAAAALLGKAPLVVTIHDLLPFQLSGYVSRWKQIFTQMCTQISLKKSTAIIVPCKSTKDIIASRFRVPPEKIFVVSYGVDHGYYYPRPEIKRSDRKILYVGEVSRSKGVDTLIRAFAEVKQLLGEVELSIGGKRSGDQPMLEQLCCRLGLKDINFLGYIPEQELPNHYSSAAVMVFPSRCGFGLSTLEAMACGTVVITGDILDAPEYVADSVMLVDPDDIHALAENIIKVLTDPELNAQLAAKAIQRTKSFSWENMARDTGVIYQKILQAKTSG